jgi:probable phosphoglycerate mutase
MLLFYVRHGDPTYNPDSLTEKGREQANALVERMKKINPDEIYASTSNRAIQTAEPTAKALNKEITVLDWCNESYAYRNLGVTQENGQYFWAFGIKSVIDLFQTKEMRALGDRWYDHPFFAGMTCKDYCLKTKEEIKAFIKSLGYEYDEENHAYRAVNPTDKRIALFAHQGFGLLFLSLLLDIPYPQTCTHFDMGHTGVTVIEFDGKEGLVIPKVIQLSNDSHLFKAGLSTDYQNRIEF